MRTVPVAVAVIALLLPRSHAQLQRVSTAVPFPRGLAMVDGTLYVLARGVSREFGGVSRDLPDCAGTIFTVDPAIREPLGAPISGAARHNASVFASPTDPPFRLLDRSRHPIWSDNRTDRPYCALRYHERTHSFYLCAFSGIDRYTKEAGKFFTKNATDAIVRYDLRTRKWYDVERHDPKFGHVYPHPDPAPPRGWLKGPDNCLAIGDQLYAVAKDNSLLMRYDLSEIVADPTASPPDGVPVLGSVVNCRNEGEIELLGQSALASHGGYLYVGYRTSGAVLRIPVEANGRPTTPVRAELVALFQPWNPLTGESANITDLAFDEKGRLYVLSAMPARIYRLIPDPARIVDARPGLAEVRPWLDVARESGNPELKCENLLVAPGGELYVSAGQTYDPETKGAGVIYFFPIAD